MVGFIHSQPYFPFRSDAYKYLIRVPHIYGTPRSEMAKQLHVTPVLFFSSLRRKQRKTANGFVRLDRLNTTGLFLASQTSLWLGNAAKIFNEDIQRGLCPVSKWVGIKCKWSSSWALRFPLFSWWSIHKHTIKTHTEDLQASSDLFKIQHEISILKNRGWSSRQSDRLAGTYLGQDLWKCVQTLTSEKNLEWLRLY